MCGMSRAGAGGAGRGGGSERDGKFVLRSRDWGWGRRGRRGRGAQGGGHRPGGAGPRGAAPDRAWATHPDASGPQAAPGLSAPGAPFLARRSGALNLPCPTLPPQSPAGIWGSGLGGAEGGAPTSGAGLPSVQGPGCRVTRSPAEPGRTVFGSPYPLPESRAAEAERPLPTEGPPPYSSGPRPGPALEAAPALPEPGLSGSPREACFSNFSLSPSSRTSGALPLGPAPRGPRGGRLDTASQPSFGRTHDGRVGGDAGAPGA